MYNLSVDEISMVDGGGDGGYVSAVVCSVAGVGAGAVAGFYTKNDKAAALSASIVTNACLVAMGNSSNGSRGNQTAAVSSGSYNGYGLSSSGGMMGR
ncbi:hypothetical protein [Vibrio cincinnatiensis]|jgi:hypothetical protein|uniref:hypothetical protein n=1 Tax=Vibrio cincinnatiensis TaxID=675 RepID=UPI001302D05D|nr:hypothetical protein [Vibrio cincinnatiensis]